MKKTFITLVLILILMTFSGLLAGPVLLWDTVSVRSLGLMACSAALNGDAESMSLNPSSLATLNSMQASVNFLSWFQGMRLLNVSFGLPLIGFPFKGGFGLQATTFSSGSFVNYDSTGNSLPNLSASDFLMMAGFGIGRKHDPFIFGAGAKLFSTKLADINPVTGLALDAGARFRFFFKPLVGGKTTADSGLFLVVVLQNLGPGQKFVDIVSALPIKLRLAANYMFFSSSKANAFLLADINSTMSQPLKIAVAMEANLFKLISIRAGYKIINNGFGNLSFGLGLTATLGKIKGGIDYAMIPTAEFGIVNAIGIRAKF